MAAKKTTAKKTTTKKTTKKAASAKKASGKRASTKKAGVRKPAAKKPAAKKTAARKGDTKMSALDAAAKVLAESKEPLRCKEMIERMQAKGYWKSPGGKTPHATLYSAILREINTKGAEARFEKLDRGLFATNG